MGRANSVIFRCLVFLVVASATLLAGIVSALAVSADNPSLQPDNVLLQTYNSQTFSFTAVNTQPFPIKSYHVEFTYTKGLSVQNLIVEPAAATATVNTKRNTITIEWSNVAPSAEMRATFESYGNAPGKYQIVPANIYYSDFNRKTYTAVCNNAVIVVRQELIKPQPPKQLASVAGEGNIVLTWKNNTEPDLAGYNIYRSADAITFTQIGSASTATYKDALVLPNTTYYYKVTAFDTSGNESNPSLVTAETYFDLKKRTIAVTGAFVAAFGDVNGDGRKDLLLGYPQAVVGKGKSQRACGKVELYLGGSTLQSADVMLPGERGGDDFGYAIAIADLNNDGYEDVIVGAPNYDPYTAWPIMGEAPEGGKVYIYPGGPRFGSTPVLTVDGDWSYGCSGGCYYILHSENFGFSMGPVGDVNNDGYQDVAIGAPYGGMSRSGAVKILFGGPLLEGLNIAQYDGPQEGGYTGNSVSAAGDFNADGYLDLVAGGLYSNSSFIFPGGPLLGKSSIRVTGIGGDVGTLDFNGDGISDVVLASEGMHIYFGGPEQREHADISLLHASLPLISLHDLNKDGYDDLLADGPSVYYGNQQGDAVADVVRTGVSVLSGGTSLLSSDNEVVVTDYVNTYIYSFAPYTALPQVTFYYPQSDITVHEPSITISGKVEGSITQLLVQGKAVPVAENGLFFATVSLDELDNVLEFLAMTPDNKVSKRTINIYYYKLPPLTISISMPTEGQLLTSSPVRVSGAVSDINAEITINGIPPYYVGNPYYYAEVPLAEGPQTITATAVDSYGRTASSSISVTLQIRGTVRGSVTDLQTGMPISGVVVTLVDASGSRSANTDTSGAYSFTGVSDGPFSLTFAKQGYAGQTVQGTVVAGQTIILDAQLVSVPLLTVSIDLPQEGAVLTANPVVVSGSVSNNASVTVNGVTAAVGNGMFLASLGLNDGAHIITAIAQDPYGQSASCSVSVRVATKGSISGQVSDGDSGATVENAEVSVRDVNGNGYMTATDANGAFTLSDLQPGSYTGSIRKEGYRQYTFDSVIEAGEITNMSVLLVEITPLISDVRISDATIDAVTIVWDTDMPSQSTLSYGETMAYGSEIQDQEMKLTHQVTVSGLLPETTYHFRITARNVYSFSSMSDDLSATTKRFSVTSVGDFGPVTVMEVMGDYSAKNPDGTFNTFPRQEIAREFLKSHSDNYDFLVIISNFDFTMPDPQAEAYYLEILNDIQGIGKPVFDNSLSYGSNGKLQGIIDMGNRAFSSIGPADPRFGKTLNTLAHEQTHRWGAQVKFRGADGNISFALLGKDGTHWSYLLDTDGSLMYGNDWTDNADGSFTSVSASRYYSVLDLYLMGFIDKSQMPALRLIENVAIDATRLPEPGATISGTARSITIEDIIAAGGERIPNATASQKTFKTAFILITRPGTFLGTEPADIEILRNAWAGRFAELTHGRGSIADVPPTLSLTVTSPTEGQAVADNEVMVRGTLINTTGNETGVTVNGVIAVVSGNQFIANRVPLTEGQNTILITATDSAENTVSTSVSVNAVTTGNYLRLVPNIESGISPLEVMLRVDGSFSISASNLNVTGSVQPEVLSSAPEEYKLRFPVEGVYYVTVTAAGPDGGTYQDTVAITVMNRTQLDMLLKAKWEGMKTALMAGDIGGGIAFFRDSAREKYYRIFSTLSARVPVLAAELPIISMCHISSDVAEYRISRLEVIGGQPRDITYFVYFSKDRDGLWKMESL